MAVSIKNKGEKKRKENLLVVDNIISLTSDKNKGLVAASAISLLLTS